MDDLLQILAEEELDPTGSGEEDEVKHGHTLRIEFIGRNGIVEDTMVHGGQTQPVSGTEDLIPMSTVPDYVPDCFWNLKVQIKLDICRCFRVLIWWGCLHLLVFPPSNVCSAIEPAEMRN